MEFGLIPEYQKILYSIFQSHNFIKKVVVYGSRAIGNFSDRSDIDLIIFSEDNNRFDLANVLYQIENSKIPYNIDLQFYDDVKNTALLDHINRVGKTFFIRNSENNSA